jgi:hypothetical protein
MSEKPESSRSAWEKFRRKDSVRMPGSDLVKYPFENKLYGFNTKESYSYETRNSLAFRCDEFKNKHDGKHILFTGCSVTHGVGLELEETWAHKLYTKISEKESVSGYYNLGVPGTGIFFAVSNLFKYFNKYGNPDVIFINLTDMLRFYSVEEFSPDIKKQYRFKDMVYILSKYIYHDQDWSNEQGTSAYWRWVHYYDYVMMLEAYCKSNNIKLFIFSYAGPTEETFKRVGLDRFYEINPSLIIDMLIQYAADNKVDEYFLTARDGMHEGHGLHEQWAEKLFEFYSMEGNDVN